MCLKMNNKGKEIGCKIFQSCKKKEVISRSIFFEDEINLQDLNGLDMGRSLHSTNTWINIVIHIGEEMRELLIKEIIESKIRFSIIIDESTSSGGYTLGGSWPAEGDLGQSKVCAICIFSYFLVSYGKWSPITFLCTWVYLTMSLPMEYSGV